MTRLRHHPKSLSYPPKYTQIELKPSTLEEFIFLQGRNWLKNTLIYIQYVHGSAIHSLEKTILRLLSQNSKKIITHF